MVQVLEYRVDGAFPNKLSPGNRERICIPCSGFTGKGQVPEYDLASRYSWHLDTAPDL